MSNTLLDQIDALVASKTFNLDALDGIKKIKDDLQKTLASLEYTQEKLEDANKRIAAMTQELAREREQTLNWKDKASTNAKAAEEGRNAVWEKKIAEGVASAYMHSMEIVFKPYAVRESVQRSVAKPVNGTPAGNGYNGSAGFLVNGSESETVTKEEL